MKSRLIFVIAIQLSLTLVACGRAPQAQEKGPGSLADNPELSKVVLEVSTIT